MLTGVIDSHCHLNHSNNAAVDKPVDIMARARTAGVAGALTICCEIAGEFDQVRHIAETVPNVWCSVGTHPEAASNPVEKAITVEDIVACTRAPRVIGIGETGLDYYYSPHDKADQAASFRKHIQAAVLADLPLIIHARDADEDIIKILRAEGAGANPRVRGVMHCFTAGPWLAEQALAIGFYISFSGIVTFKKAEELRKVAKMVPLDRLLVETDAPFLAPEPLRGKVNEPAYILHTVRLLAALHNLDERGAIAHCNQNFFRLFNKAEEGV
jgi:TatD DNase family protein